MRLTQLAAMLVMGVGVAVGFGMGVKGVVNRNLGGVEEHNQAIEDAMGGKTDNKLPVAAGAVKAGWLTRKSKDGKDVRLYFAYPAALTKAKPAAGLIVLQEWWGVNEDM